jgi:hypothetical protein
MHPTHPMPAARPGSPEPPGARREAVDRPEAGDEAQPDPLALDPLSPIAAPDRRWFVPAHRPF